MSEKPKISRALHGDSAYILEALVSGAWLEIPTIRKTWSAGGKVGRVGSIIRSREDQGTDTASDLGLWILTRGAWITATRKTMGVTRYDVNDHGRRRLAEHHAHHGVMAARLRHWKQHVGLSETFPQQFKHPGPEPEPYVFEEI